MRCSTCSKEIEPIVAVDIDGTLGDYHRHFERFAMNWLGYRPVTSDTYDGSIPYRNWFRAAYRVDFTTFRLIKLAYRQGGLKRTMPAYGGMPELVKAVRYAGAEIWLTTTRPYLRLDGIDPDTREWLRRNNVPYDGLLYDEDKYGKLAQNVDKERVVAVVDDLPEQYDAAAAVFGEGVPILRGTEYNRAVQRQVRVESVHILERILTQRVSNWREVHAGHASHA